MKSCILGDFEAFSFIFAHGEDYRAFGQHYVARDRAVPPGNVPNVAGFNITANFYPKSRTKCTEITCFHHVCGVLFEHMYTCSRLKHSNTI